VPAAPESITAWPRMKGHFWLIFVWADAVYKCLINIANYSVVLRECTMYSVAVAPMAIRPYYLGTTLAASAAGRKGSTGNCRALCFFWRPHR
jgi:hypothetical protein